MVSERKREFESAFFLLGGFVFSDALGTMACVMLTTIDQICIVSIVIFNIRIMQFTGMNKGDLCIDAWIHRCYDVSKVLFHVAQ